jgi:hypothetical protein
MSNEYLNNIDNTYSFSPVTIDIAQKVLDELSQDSDATVLYELKIIDKNPPFAHFLMSKSIPLVSQYHSRLFVIGAAVAHRILRLTAAKKDEILPEVTDSLVIDFLDDQLLGITNPYLEPSDRIEMKEIFDLEKLSLFEDEPNLANVLQEITKNLPENVGVWGGASDVYNILKRASKY